MRVAGDAAAVVAGLMYLGLRGESFDEEDEFFRNIDF